MLSRLIVSFLLSLASPLAAAELTLVSYRFSDETPKVHLHLSGEIAGEEAAKIAKAFETLARCSGASCNNDYGGPRAVVTLNSPGGAYSAGVKLANFFRQNHIATVVEAGDACLSACAVAFLGGSSFWLTGGIGTFIDRSIEPGARLGFHSPYFTTDIAAKAAAAGKLDQLLNVTRLSIADIVETLTRYNVSPRVLDQIIRMGPDGFYEVSTPAALHGIRARLATFDPNLLNIPWMDQFRHICERLVALQYGHAPVPLPKITRADLRRETDEHGTELLLYDLDDRPLNVSGCAVEAELEGQMITAMGIYRWEGVPDHHSALHSYYNGIDGGWSTLGYRGGRATDGFVTLGTFNHMVLPLDYELAELPQSVIAAIFRMRGRDSSPNLPTHSRNWPVTQTHQTPWSRSYSGAGMQIVEQVGPARLFDDISAFAGDTDIMFERDGRDFVVRSGEDTAAGTSYYWFALKSGAHAATIRVEAPVLANQLSQEQKDLMSLVACSTDFNGVHLGCYR